MVPVEITIFEDRSFAFVLKTPPGVGHDQRGAEHRRGSLARQGAIGTISRDQVREIAQIKMKDLNATTPENAEKIIEGTARSMGVAVES